MPHRPISGRIPTLSASLLLAATAIASAATVNYNTPGDLTTYFNLNVSPPVTNKYVQTASGGLLNSGAVDLMNTTDQDHTTAVYNDASWSFANPGDSVTIEQFILRQNAIITQTPFISMGLLSDATGRMDGGTSTNSYASVRLNPSLSTTSTDVFAQVETKVEGGGRIRTTIGSEFSLTAGHWYRLSTTFTYDSATALFVSASLDDWGTTGTAFDSTAFSFGPTSIGLSGTNQVNGDGTVWAGYRAFHEGGADFLDNFSAVPEPATLSLLGLSLIMLRRRRWAQAG